MVLDLDFCAIPHSVAIFNLGVTYTGKYIRPIPEPPSWCSRFKFWCPLPWGHGLLHLLQVITAWGDRFLLNI